MLQEEIKTLINRGRIQLIALEGFQLLRVLILQGAVKHVLQGGRTYVMITYVSKENNLGPDDKIRYSWGLKGPIFILLSAAGPHLLLISISNVIIL